jgi:hypothetical protein
LLEFRVQILKLSYLFYPLPIKYSFSLYIKWTRWLNYFLLLAKKRNENFWGRPGPVIGPTGNIFLNETKFPVEDSLAGNYSIFWVDIPGEHFLIGKSDFFKRNITGERGFAENSANISFGSISLLTFDSY